MKLSIIIVTQKDREDLLTICLESISVSQLPADHEILIILNGPASAVTQILSQPFCNNLNVSHFQINECTPGAARNKAITKAQGEILYFIDDDVIVEKTIFTEIIKKFTSYSEFDIIGGPNLTPSTKNIFHVYSGYVLSSLWGASSVRHRYKKLDQDTDVNEMSLILCNLAMRRTLLEKEKLSFNKWCSCNEETILLYQLRLKGYKMLASPDLIVYHHRRDTLLDFSKQIFKYGKGRMEQTIFFPTSIPLFAIIPSLFVLYLFSILFINNNILFIPLWSYVILNTFFSLFFSIKCKKISSFFYFFIIFFSNHVSYGLGFLSGISFLFKKPKKIDNY